MLAVIKKELKKYFLSPIGYVVIGIFLLIFSIFFYLTSIQQASIDLTYLFYYAALYGLMLIIPILTMGLFSDERKSGTEQLLMTSPISMTKIVLAKFIAATIIIIITELCTLMYFGILSHYAVPDIPTYLTSALGFLILAMVYIAFGMLASSITEHQIIAGVITTGFVIGTTFLPYFVEAISGFSLIDLFAKFLYGEIDIANTITFISIIVLCLLTTMIFMQRRKSVK